MSTSQPEFNYGSHDEHSSNDDELQDLQEKWGIDHIAPPSTSILQSLKDTYEQGDSEAFEMFFEDIAADFLSNNSPEFTKNIQNMRRTANPEAQQRIKDRQLILFKEAKEFIADLAALPAHATLTEIEAAKARIHHRLITSLQRDPKNFDPLSALGILTTDDKGTEHFTYPRGVFPAATDAKWYRYLDAVAQHIKAANALSRGTSSQSDVEHADRDRRVAHNSIARDVKDLLSLPGDDIEESRRLVVKMRENRFPNVDTSEKARTNEALRIGATVVSGMYEHLLPRNTILYEPHDDL